MRVWYLKQISVEPISVARAFTTCIYQDWKQVKSLTLIDNCA